MNKPILTARLSDGAPLLGVSLFASGGLGDLALRGAGVDVIVANELLEDRASLFRENFKQTETLSGDIRNKQDEIIHLARKELAGRQLDILLATPPCQGMSKNGRGKLLNGMRQMGGVRLDPRNELVIPTVQIIKELRPRVVVFENVPEMENTIISVGDPPKLIGILEYIQSELSPEYVGSWRVIEFADYGVPQRRQRLITIFTRDVEITRAMRRGQIFPQPTHSQSGGRELRPWVTVRDVIAGLPKLDAQSKSESIDPSIPFHEVPLLDEHKYFWVSNTPAERSAFDNQCIDCGFDQNPTHRAVRIDGINRASSETPLYCVKCNSLLPRPWAGEPDNKRIMKGFTSAYKRMAWDQPCSTLTTNFAYACSDNKLHPEQNRTLSTHEALLLHTVADFSYSWKMAGGKPAKKQLVRDVIGESVPPRGLKVIFDHIASLLQGRAPHDFSQERQLPFPEQQPLF